MKRIVLTTLIFSIALISCKKESIVGEGRIITENRTLLARPGFDAIKINGSTAVHVIYGSEYKLEVKGYENLLNVFSTEITNHTLTVEFKNNYNIRNDNTEIFITMPVMPDIYLNGSAEAEVKGNFPFKDQVVLKVNGSGEMEYGSGSVEHLELNISGSGSINILAIEAETAAIQISGSGEVKLAVSDELDASISGSGKIYYSGSPVINANISGSGKVIKLN